MPFFSAMKLVASVTTAHVATTPGPIDTCKTPSPGGPVPLPYPNVGVSSTMGSGYATKVLSTGTPTWTKNGETAMTNGDQPGSLMGILSNKIMGVNGIIMCSTDVKAEGGGLVRSMDSANGNG